MRSYYHITPTSNLESILKNGLVPAIGPRSQLIKEIEPGIYLFTSKIAAEDALSSWLGENLPVEPVSLLKVNNVEIDENWVTARVGYEKVCTNVIPPENIEVIDKDF